MKNKKNFGFEIFPKNSRAWIRIIEAFFSILLIAGALLIVIYGAREVEFTEPTIYDREIDILREIEVNSAFRGNILDVASVPVSWNQFEAEGLTEVKNKIIARTPNYLTCEATLCGITEECSIDNSVLVNIYTSSVGIYANTEKYSPKQLKLFCWEK